MAVAALAATAVAAEEEFAPYIAGVSSLMAKLMSLNEEKLYSLRGRALECMGHMAIAVGKENFRPYFQETMRCACEGLTFDSTDLHEFAYAVFANLSKVMGEEFAPVLGELVPHLVKVIGQDEGQLEQADEAAAVSFYVCQCTLHRHYAFVFLFLITASLTSSEGIAKSCLHQPEWPGWTICCS